MNKVCVVLATCEISRNQIFLSVEIGHSCTIHLLHYHLVPYVSVCLVCVIGVCCDMIKPNVCVMYKIGYITICKAVLW